MFRVATGDCLGEYADTAPGDQFYDKTVKSVVQIEEPISALFFTFSKSQICSRI